MEGDGGDGDLIYGRLVSYTVLWCKSGYTRCKLGICGVYLHRAVYYTPALYLSVPKTSVEPIPGIKPLDNTASM